MLTVGMDSLGLLLVVATGLVAFHVAIALYLYRVASAASGHPSPSDTDQSPQADGPQANANVDAPRRADARGERLVRCGICGAPNDPTYRFCRRCIADLSGTGRRMNEPGATERLGS